MLRSVLSSLPIDPHSIVVVQPCDHCRPIPTTEQTVTLGKTSQFELAPRGAEGILPHVRGNTLAQLRLLHEKGAYLLMNSSGAHLSSTATRSNARPSAPAADPSLLRVKALR